MNRIYWINLLAVCGLTACVYSESPNGRFAALDIPLPVQNETTIHKTVTVNAPAGTTVLLQETQPIIYHNATPRPISARPICYYDGVPHAPNQIAPFKRKQVCL